MGIGGSGLCSILPSVIGNDRVDRDYDQKRQVHTSKGNEGPRSTRKPLRIAVHDSSHEREPPKKQIDNQLLASSILTLVFVHAASATRCCNNSTNSSKFQM